MLSTVLWLLLAAWLISGGVLAIILARAPYMPEQPTWEEHVATARAALQPDDPTLPEASFADQVEMWLELHTAKES